MSTLLNQLLQSSQPQKTETSKTQDSTKTSQQSTPAKAPDEAVKGEKKDTKPKRKQDPNTKHKYIKRKVFLEEQAKKKSDPLAVPVSARSDLIGVVPDDFPLSNKRLGRRNSIPGNRRDLVLNFNVSTAERAVIDAEVQRRGISMSMFLRCAVFDGMNLPRPHPEIMMHYSEYVNKANERAPELRRDIAAPRPGKYGRFYDAKKPKGERQIRHSDGLEDGGDEE
jgi:hypothetical protein